jgi:hypothetical protein
MAEIRAQIPDDFENRPRHENDIAVHPVAGLQLA